MDLLSSLDRQQVRSLFRKKRQALSSTQQTQAANDILSTCADYSKLQQAKTVACYLANDSEISPESIIEYCWQHNKQVLLPVLHPFSQGSLVFVQYTASTPMRINVYGIPEPVISTQQLCPLANIDLILTPLVAFDTQGNRLGMGGGYYDRTLAPIRRDCLPTQIIGLAHTCQQTDSLLSDSWDIPLDGIATPNQFFSVR